jgi:DNA polymerase III sliding clamp (beta) subunit (PCNA family)
MSLTLSRVNLYEALTNAARVTNGTLASAKFARVEARAADRVVMITTFNGQTAIESILAGDVADDMLTYVDAQTLLKLVMAMPEGAITLALKDNELTMTTGDGKHKNDLKIGSDVEIPVIAGSTMTEMAKIAGIELRRLARAVKFASMDEAKTALMAVHVAFNKPGDSVIAVASATDGFAAIQSLAPVISCAKTAVGKAITFPASFVSLLLDTVRPDDQVTIHRSGENRFIISVTNDKTGKNLALASTESSAVLPVDSIATMIKSTKDGADVNIEVDTSALENALDIIGAYTRGGNDLAYFYLAVHDGAIRYASNPTENGQCRAILDGTAAGPKASRWFNPGMLRKAVSLMPEKTRAAMPSKPKTPILFMGDNIRVMVAPMDNAALKDVKFEEAAAIELPLQQSAVVESVSA